ncbi:MAG: efflux RND transporter periplasmic adaptor subunit [Longimicrobiales bacterium]
MCNATRYGLLALACISVVLAGCGGAGGVQRDTGEAGDGEPAGGAITLWTDSTELFMEHPALIVGQAGTFAVHLTDLTDASPLVSGRVTMRFTPRDGGEAVIAVQDTPRAPGIYGPAPTFQRPGVYDLAIEVESPQARDVIRVESLRVYASADEAPSEEAGEEGGIAFLKEQQWKTSGFRTEFARHGTVSESFQVTGEVVPAAGRYAIVAAPIGGLVETSGVARSPAPGQAVRQGATLAVITPTLGDAGGGSVFAAARRELREAEDEHARAKRLLEVEAIPARRLHEAEIRLDAAREALAGLDPEAVSAGGRLAVSSPIAGVIATRDITPGARVEAGQPLFSVVDPSVVWLKVNVPAAQAPLVGSTSAASFRLGNLERMYESRRVISVGSIVDAASRTVPVIYEVANPDGTIRIGSVATVSIHTGQPIDGVVVPNPAILEEDGGPVAYVQLDGETFERRELQVGGTESGLTLVLSGIRDGERVVTGSAYQVRLASLSTAVPAHGHEH